MPSRGRMTCVWPTADCKSAVTGVRPGPEPVTEGDGSAACQNMRLTQIESVLVNHQVQAVCATRISVIPVRSLGLPGLAAGWPTARRQRSPGGPDTLFVAALDGEPLAFANGHADTITLLAPAKVVANAAQIRRVSRAGRPTSPAPSVTRTTGIVWCRIADSACFR